MRSGCAAAVRGWHHRRLGAWGAWRLGPANTAPVRTSSMRVDAPGMHGGTRYEAMGRAEKVAAFNALIARWREEGPLVRVLPASVIPDTTNREGTGISVMHAHYLADSILQRGFTPRNHVTGDGHDLPLLVRQPQCSCGSGSDGELSGGAALGAESLRKWKSALLRRRGYPPAQPWMARAAGDEEFFCSLGNGHFFQALNLFAGRCRRKLVDAGAGLEPGQGQGRRFFTIGADALLVRGHPTPNFARHFLAGNFPA
eukprot:COSAG01_NODE_4247_length_5209_cov_2.889237_5_plen_256_part_00